MNNIKGLNILNTPIAFLGTIILLGAVLRLTGLTTSDIWLDEAVTIAPAQLLSPLPLIENISRNDFHPPLYYLQLHYWLKLGESDWFIRLNPTIYGILSIFFIYLLGTRIWNKKVGLFSAFLLSISPYHVWYSQEVRMYEMFFFLVLVSCYFLYRILNEQEANVVLWIGYIISTVLVLYSHAVSFYVVVVHNIYLIILFFYHRVEKRTLIFWILSQLVILLTFFPFIILILQKFYERNGIGKPSLVPLIEALGFFVTGSKRAFCEIYGFVLLPIFLGICIRGINKIYREPQKLWFILSLSLIPLLIPIIISFIIKPIFLHRSIIYVSLPIYLIIAVGVLSDYTTKFRKLIVWGCIAILILAMGMVLVKQKSGPKKQQWKSVATLIKSQYQKDDLILLNAEFIIWPFNYYFDKEKFKLWGRPKKEITMKIAMRECQVGLTGIDEVTQKIGKVTAGRNRVWIIFSHTSTERGKKEIIKYMQNHYKAMVSYSFISIEVLLYSDKKE